MFLRQDNRTRTMPKSAESMKRHSPNVVAPWWSAAILVAFALALLCGVECRGQGSKADYERAGEPRFLGYNSPFVPPWQQYGEAQIPVKRRTANTDPAAGR